MTAAGLLGSRSVYLAPPESLRLVSHCLASLSGAGGSPSPTVLRFVGNVSHGVAVTSEWRACDTYVHCPVTVSGGRLTLTRQLCTALHGGPLLQVLLLGKESTHGREALLADAQQLSLGCWTHEATGA